MPWQPLYIVHHAVDMTASVADRKRRPCLESAVINRCRIVIGVERIVYVYRLQRTKCELILYAAQRIR
eukprot:scaffold36868_cov131-Skeletonema_marinoi.AAC.1